MAAVALTQQQEIKKPLIPKLAQDLIAGTIGGWAQVVVGKASFLFVLDLLDQSSVPRLSEMALLTHNVNVM